MPRKKVEPAVIPTTSLVAAATRYPGKVPRIYLPTQSWQEECYRHYAICGEARFAAKFFGHAVSRAVLSIATISGGEKESVKEGPAVDLLDGLFNGAMAQMEMLDQIGVHLTIAGECYLVGRTVDGLDVWEIVSVLEMKVNGQRWSIDHGDGQKIELADNDVVIRIWLPHPAKSIEADSPFRALLPILSEIEWLTRHVHAQITSRLAGSGILMLPQDMTFPPPQASNGKEIQTANEADAFMLTLADAMMTPISEPGSPSALVPIVVTAPSDSIDKARLLQFWSQLDSAVKDLRAEAIRRFALGMDLPPEQVLGMSSNGGTGGGTSNGVSHWGAWQIEEATIKMHVEPMLDVICNAITIGYLRPLLDEDSVEIITYSTAALRLRPDRSREAIELYDRGLVSARTVLTETGFSDEDMPDEEEFQRWLLVKIATGSSTPEQLQAALKELGVDLKVEYPQYDSGDTQELPSDRSLDDHPSRPRDPSDSPDYPRRRYRRRRYYSAEDDTPDPLLAAADALVWRALERAGNRLRQTGARPPGVPSYETHVHVAANGTASRLLEDAWSCAPQILDGIADFEQIVPILDSYCQTLFVEQSPHTRERLEAWLDLAEESS